MKKAFTVFALAALMFTGAALAGCASKGHCCGTEPGKCCKDTAACEGCKAAGGQCEACKAHAK